MVLSVAVTTEDHLQNKKENSNYNPFLPKVIEIYLKRMFKLRGLTGKERDQNIENNDFVYTVSYTNTALVNIIVSLQRVKCLKNLVQ